MKPFYTLIFIILNTTFAFSQRFDVKDLVEFTSYSINKFDNYVGKREFKRDYFAPHESATLYNYVQRRKKKDSVMRTIAWASENGKASIHYQTSAAKEQRELLQQLKDIGFRSYVSSEGDVKEGEILQKDNLRTYTSIEIKDSTTLYTFVVERKDLPKARDLQYAEDLLPLTSHEYLCYVFGEQAVKKDVFYYSETETNKCSVLFPNTNRQLIFIWNDEKNYSNTAFILVGGQLRPTATSEEQVTVEHNLWRSKQGVYTGMSLKELQVLNEGPVNFYSWDQERAGMLAPKNQGKIDFTKIGFVLNCLNCVGAKYQQTTIVNSESQLELGKKVFVSSIIILPEKEKPATASR